MDRSGSRFGHRCFGLPFSRTSKAKKLKEKVCDTFHKITGQAEDMLDEAKEKAVDAGKTVADKMADKAFGLAEKTDDLRTKCMQWLPKLRNKSEQITC